MASAKKKAVAKAAGKKRAPSAATPRRRSSAKKVKRSAKRDKVKPGRKRPRPQAPKASTVRHGRKPSPPKGATPKKTREQATPKRRTGRAVAEASKRGLGKPRKKPSPPKGKKKPLPVIKTARKVNLGFGRILAKRYAQANARYTKEKTARKRRERAEKISKQPRKQAQLRKEDFHAWEDAGKPGTFAAFQKHRAAWRTRRHESKLHELDTRRRQIFGYADEDGNELIPRYLEAHGSNRDDREVLKAMLRERDPRFLEYMEAAEELGIGHDEAMDGWFSPEV